jgi:hypothetical protein
MHPFAMSIYSNLIVYILMAAMQPDHICYQQK